MDILVSILIRVFFGILESLPEWSIGQFLDRIGKKSATSQSEGVVLFPSECGATGVELAQQRLLVSAAFGTYFAGLLEQNRSYVEIKSQIDSPTSPNQQGLEPLQRIYWTLQSPKDPQVLAIAGEGGMGKSTLAAKIVRCLYEQHAVDMILGDSAKTQKVDPVTGMIQNLDHAYYDPQSFYARLCAQLGLPDKVDKTGTRQVLRHITDRLIGRRAVIIVDNLETVAEGSELLTSLRSLLARDVRVIITTRNIGELEGHTSRLYMVRLRPLKEFADAYEFLTWHIQMHAGEHPSLLMLGKDIKNRKRVHRLIERTGGVPLLMQLVISDIARSSWGYIEGLPQLFGNKLLDFLYQTRWEELRMLGQDGPLARRLLVWIAGEQYRGRKVTFDRLRKWATENEDIRSPLTALDLLYERFLIVNHNTSEGNFALFPSLVEFLQRQE